MGLNRQAFLQFLVGLGGDRGLNDRGRVAVSGEGNFPKGKFVTVAPIRRSDRECLAGGVASCDSRSLLNDRNST